MERPGKKGATRTDTIGGKRSGERKKDKSIYVISSWKGKREKKGKKIF